MAEITPPFCPDNRWGLPSFVGMCIYVALSEDRSSCPQHLEARQNFERTDMLSRISSIFWGKIERLERAAR